MSKEVIDGTSNVDVKLQSRNPSIEFDELQIYFGMPFIIDVESAKGSVTVTQPSIGDIVTFGEKRFYSNLSIFITNTTSYRSMLWDQGIDWNDISDFELFTFLFKGIDIEASSLMFRDLDFTKFELYAKNVPSLNDDGEEEMKQVPVLYDKEHEIEINEEVYHNFCQYLRNVFQIFPEEKLTKDSSLKRMYIDKDKREAKNNLIKKDEKSSLKTIISACVNHPGFKYKLDEVKDMHVAQFYDSVKRLQIYEQATACLKGMYSGMVDSKKISPDAYNFMKD